MTEYSLPPAETSLLKDRDWLAQAINPHVAIIGGLAALILVLQSYWAQASLISNWLKPWVPAAHLEMSSSLLWCASICFLYLCLPVLCIRFVLKQSLSDYGLSLAGLRHHWRPYLVFFLIMLGPLLYAASTPAFQQAYPFFKYVKQSWWQFAIWEIAYGIQFVSVEFFFRGFLLFGLYRYWGINSLFVVMIPYCMIHFPKPMGESIGAILAGLALGYLALKNRSVWGGAALHWSVALTMDLATIII